MRTGVGRTFPTMAMCGFPTNQRDGLRIAMATGRMSLITAGHGLATSLGDGRRITTVGGSRTVDRGRGGRGRFMVEASTVRSGRRLMCRSLGGAADSASDLVLADGAALGGFRSGRVTSSIRGGVDIAGGLGWSA